MSELNFRTALKMISNLNIDSQYAYQLGLNVFNDNPQTREQNIETYRNLCDNLRKICNDLQDHLQEIKKSIPEM